jgi:hypothetical protein
VYEKAANAFRVHFADLSLYLIFVQDEITKPKRGNSVFVGGWYFEEFGREFIRSFLRFLISSIATNYCLVTKGRIPSV